MKARILVTGANGFVGRALVNHLKIGRQYDILPVVRRDNAFGDAHPFDVINIGEINQATHWQEILSGCSIVVHTAARVHITKDCAVNPLKEYRKINVDGTITLAKQAVAAGVKRFIFMSSIKVNGDASLIDTPFTTEVKHKPFDHYAVSKYEAEMALLELSQKTGMAVVIIRPPLVYGPGVKGNFERMLKWIQRGAPLPLGAVKNKRSLVSIDNLISLVMACIEHPNAANQVFLVSDDDDLSITDLLKKLRRTMELPVPLIAVPAWILHAVGKMLGQKENLQRLCLSLQVDISKTKELLGWKPIETTDMALSKTVQYFIENQQA